MNFLTFLDKKPLYYKAFDPTRMQKAFDSIRDRFTFPQIIHVIGTNGKGSTGRYLAQMLRQQGQSVGHYTSPHILKFNERLWMNGHDCSNESIQDAFLQLIELLDKKWQEELSYFEFTTLLSLVLFQDLDVIVLEAGLGGEHDATSVFPNSLTLVTPIGLDHADFLGSTLIEVAQTKLKAVQKMALIAKQEKEVHDVADMLSKEFGWSLKWVDDFELTLSDQACIDAFYKENGVDYLVSNFRHALTALRLLGFNEAINVERISTIFGRLSQFSENITIDVGHNMLAAEKILAHFGNCKVNLVYNSLVDKPYKEILKLLQPIVKKVLLLPIEGDRAVDIAVLEAYLIGLDMPYDIFSRTESDENYLVFGSFLVVESFLKRVNA